MQQLSDTSFYAKVDKDHTLTTNQQTVKSTVNDLIVKQELPATASNLNITRPRTLYIYFCLKFTNLTIQIVSACSCSTELISQWLFRQNYDKLIFTRDIIPLYAVIPNGEGLLALKHFLI